MHFLRRQEDQTLGTSRAGHLASILLQVLTEFSDSADLLNEELAPIPKRPRFMPSTGTPTTACLCE